MDMQSAEFRQEMKSELGSLALEGLAPDAETLADLELVYQGKMTFEQAMENVFTRLENDEGYQAMAADKEREAEAMEWCNALSGDIADARSRVQSVK